MKKMFNIPGFSRFAIVGIALSAILLSACSKNDSSDFDPPDSAGLMLVNLAPDKSSVGFSLSGNQLNNTGLGYTNYSGGYLPIYTGSRELRSFDFNNGSTISSTTGTFEDSSYYSAFLIGVDGQYRHILVEDDFTTVLPAAGKAWVRYINAVADTSARPDVTIGATTEGAVFGTVSDFTQVNAGSLNTAITAGSFNATRTLTLAENRIYTVLFVGKPGSADPALQVQVKFIENGTASN